MIDQPESPAEPFDSGVISGPEPVVSPLDSGTLAQRRTVAIAELILCSGVPTQIVLANVLAALGWEPGLSLSFVVTISLADTVLLILMMMWLTRAHGDSVSELWLGHRPLVKEVLLGIVLVPWIFMIVMLLLLTMRVLTPGLHNVPTNPLEQMASGGAAQVAVFGAMAILAGGVREELQRAFLLRRFERHLFGARVGVIVLSLAFGLGHYLQGWDAAIATGTLGAVWAVLYLRRRSSIAPIVSHAGFNSLEVLRIAILGG